MQGSVLRGAAEQRFYNTSPLTFQFLLNDADNLFAYPSHGRSWCSDSNGVIDF